MADKITLAGPSEPCGDRYDAQRLAFAAENAAGYANAALAFARERPGWNDDYAETMKEVLDDIAEELLFSLVTLMGWDAVRFLVDKWKPETAGGADGEDG